MTRRLSKEDKQFLVTTAICNRDFLLNIENIKLSLVIAITAAIVSIFSIILTLKLFDPLLACVVPAVLIVVVWINWYYSNKKLVRRIYKIRGRYTKQLKELYPDIQDDDLSI